MTDAERAVCDCSDPCVRQPCQVKTACVRQDRLRPEGDDPDGQEIPGALRAAGGLGPGGQ